MCPRCRSVVVPAVDAHGALHCPACNDTGVVQAQPAWGQPAAPPGYPPPYAPAAPNADGAVMALVFGILALAVPYVGIVFGIMALVFAKKADRAIAASGGQLQGRGMVMGGRIVAVIGLIVWGVALLIVGSAVVFVLVSNLGAADSETAPNIAFAKNDSGLGGSLTVVQAESGLDWSELQVAGSADCVAPPRGGVQAGDVITCRTAGFVEVVHLPTNTLVYASSLDD